VSGSVTLGDRRFHAYAIRMGTVRSVLVADVAVGKDRRPLGPLNDLKDSIARLGLLHPITVTPGLKLIAGHHRLAACAALGWKRIPATVLPISRLSAELAGLDENLSRSGLTVLQRAEALARRKELYQLVHPETRRGVAGGRARQGRQQSETVSFAVDVARRVRLTPRSVHHEIQIAREIPRDIRAVLHGTAIENRKRDLLYLARLPHDEQRRIATFIASGRAKRVREAESKLVAARLARKRAPLPTGRFAVIVVDPPWPTDEQHRPYPAMGEEEILALPVDRLAEADAILFLWVPSGEFQMGLDCITRWGFSQKHVLVWKKMNAQPGHLLLSQCEICLVATRGKPKMAWSRASNVISASAREHSRKPDEFYELVKRAFIGPRLDMFARESRSGWTTWGAETNKFDRAG
jgi:N6-adenosine-specific RNA methylase IME4